MVLLRHWDQIKCRRLSAEHQSTWLLRWCFTRVTTFLLIGGHWASLFMRCWLVWPRSIIRSANCCFLRSDSPKWFSQTKGGTKLTIRMNSRTFASSYCTRIRRNVSAAMAMWKRLCSILFSQHWTDKPFSTAQWFHLLSPTRISQVKSTRGTLTVKAPPKTLPRLCCPKRIWTN